MYFMNCRFSFADQKCYMLMRQFLQVMRAKTCYFIGQVLDCSYAVQAFGGVLS
jgi:hypothetical protein